MFKRIYTPRKHPFPSHNLVRIEKRSLLEKKLEEKDEEKQKSVLDFFVIRWKKLQSADNLTESVFYVTAHRETIEDRFIRFISM
jgi:hypothetical protein